MQGTSVLTTPRGQLNIIFKPRLIVVFAVCLGLVATPVGAAPTTFFGADLDNSLFASAAFDTSGTELIVTLSNISSFDVLVPVDVLTAIFFDIAGDPTLTRISATLAPGSSVVNPPPEPTDPGPDGIGGEWAYKTGLSGVSGMPLGNPTTLSPPNQGISSVGLGPFGPGDRFPGNNLAGPDSPNGLQYGLTSAGDDITTGNNKVKKTPLIQNAAVFALGGLPAGFDPSTGIFNVTFHYGTSFDEPNVPAIIVPGDDSNPSVPEPSSLILLGIGILGLFGYGWRRRKQLTG
jgi:hypothetical protein